MNDRIVIPNGIEGAALRLRLRQYLSDIEQLQSTGTDLQCEIAVCQKLLRDGSVNVSFAGQARDMRRAFYAIKRMVGKVGQRPS
ncbi:MAG TPA: hypothetical protein VI794_01600 [Patescibacteria group bacterium]|nr:hypothetical protein [Patescibacteria group bacterium]